ncbi:MAG: ferritin-like domain-containing protein [Pseudolabrys sp.]
MTKAFAQRGASYNGVVDLGSGDIGILNYAYALEQLEAAYYTMVMARPYAGMSGRERSYLSDIRSHEVAHRNFLRGALGGNAIPALEVDFSSVDFSSRESVLTTAATFEDLGVSAYNGAGQYLQNPNYLLQAGRIVSVEGRHAAILHDLLVPLGSSFAVANILGLDVEHSPGVVLASAGPYIRTPISAANIGN